MAIKLWWKRATKTAIALFLLGGYILYVFSSTLSARHSQNLPSPLLIRQLPKQFQQIGLPNGEQSTGANYSPEGAVIFKQRNNTGAESTLRASPRWRELAVVSTVTSLPNTLSQRALQKALKAPVSKLPEILFSTGAAMLVSSRAVNNSVPLDQRGAPHLQNVSGPVTIRTSYIGKAAGVVNEPGHKTPDNVSRDNLNLPRNDHSHGWQKPGSINAEGTDPERYLIYTCPLHTLCGGLADRLKGIVLGYLLANITKRQFRIFMPLPGCDWSDMMQENTIPWRVNTSQLRVGRPSSMSYLRSNSPESFKQELSTLNYRKYFGDVDIVYFRTNQDRLKWLLANSHHAADLSWRRRLNHVALYQVVINGLFKLAQSLRVEVDVLLAEASEHARKNNNNRRYLVCAQIRTGHNPNIPKDVGVIVMFHHLPNIWRFLKEYLSNSSASIFISTDSEQVHQEARQQFGSRLLQVGGKIAHVDRPIERSDVCPAMRRVLVDVHVLVSCDLLLLTRSGVGDLAAHLRGTNKGLYCMDLVSSEIHECNP